MLLHRHEQSKGNPTHIYVKHICTYRIYMCTNIYICISTENMCIHRYIYIYIGHTFGCSSQRHFEFQADEYLLVTAGSCKLGKVSRRWLQQHSAQLKTLSPQNKFQPGNALTASSVLEADRMADPSLRPCQQACLDACARGARVIEMACGTGKTRVMRELAKNFSGKVHVM